MTEGQIHCQTKGKFEVFAGVLTSGGIITTNGGKGETRSSGVGGPMVSRVLPPNCQRFDGEGHERKDQVMGVSGKGPVR